MLVLMQSAGESAVITCADGTEVLVTLVAIERNRVRIGYDAPRHIQIDRMKVHRRKQAERAA